MNRILLVDDTLTLAEEIADFLRLEDYEVTVAGNGSAALNILHSDPPDLIITDLLMPGMDGFELIKQIRHLVLFKSLPILVLSARTSDEDHARAMGAGANAFLKKPCNTELLLTAISTLMKA